MVGNNTYLNFYLCESFILKNKINYTNEKITHYHPMFLILYGL
jgi:hypothetical protein